MSSRSRIFHLVLTLRDPFILWPKTAWKLQTQHFLEKPVRDHGQMSQFLWYCRDSLISPTKPVLRHCFYHSVPTSSSYSFDQPQKGEKLRWPWNIDSYSFDQPQKGERLRWPWDIDHYISLGYPNNFPASWLISQIFLFRVKIETSRIKQRQIWKKEHH